MKFIKYGILILIAFIIILVAVFCLSKIKNKDNVTLLSPISEVTPKKTSNFSLENAPTESLKGKIATMSGEISWQARTATESAIISSPIEIQQGEKLGTGDKSNLSLVFSDVCSVEFSQNTEIEIIQTLPANIVFSQNSGIGEYAKIGSYPVSIRAKNLLVEIDGDIIVSVDPKKPIVILTIKSGKATIAYNDLKFISHEVAITNGHSYTFNYGTRRGVLK